MYGILGNHDIAAHQASTVGSRPAGVLQAAGVIRWIGSGEAIRVGDIEVRGEPYHADYEHPESYGVKVKYGKGVKKVWLSHGILVEEKERLPYECIFAKDILDTAADVVLNGHYHTKSWEKTFCFLKTARGKLVINAGSVGRVDVGDKHWPSIVLLVFDDKKNEIRHKIVKLTSPARFEDVFEETEAPVKASDEDIQAFVKALEEETGDLRTEDLRTAVEIACEGKSKEVKAAVMERLGI